MADTVDNILSRIPERDRAERAAAMLANSFTSETGINVAPYVFQQYIAQHWALLSPCAHAIHNEADRKKPASTHDAAGLVRITP